MKKLLITGGSGFIGRNLVEQLSDTYKVLSPSHKELDLTNTKEVDNFFVENPVNVVIHAAYMGGNRKSPFIEGAIEKNLQMFLNIARNEKKIEKIIFLGSGAEYDKSKPIAGIKEEEFGKAVPNDQYGLSKYLCSQMARWFPKVTTLRLFGVYGKYEDKETRFISSAICQAIDSNRIVMNQNVKFDYLYINDLVEIIKYFIDQDGKERVYNVGSGEQVDLHSIAEKVKKITGISEIVVEKEGMGKEYTCSIDRLRQEIPNLQFTGIEKGIEELYRWYKA